MNIYESIYMNIYESIYMNIYESIFLYHNIIVSEESNNLTIK